MRICLFVLVIFFNFVFAMGERIYHVKPKIDSFDKYYSKYQVESISFFKKVNNRKVVGLEGNKILIFEYDRYLIESAKIYDFNNNVFTILWDKKDVKNQVDGGLRMNNGKVLIRRGNELEIFNHKIYDVEESIIITNDITSVIEIENNKVFLGGKEELILDVETMTINKVGNYSDKDNQVFFEGYYYLYNERLFKYGKEFTITKVIIPNDRDEDKRIFSGELSKYDKFRDEQKDPVRQYKYEWIDSKSYKLLEFNHNDNQFKHIKTLGAIGYKYPTLIDGENIYFFSNIYSYMDNSKYSTVNIVKLSDIESGMIELNDSYFKGSSVEVVKLDDGNILLTTSGKSGGEGVVEYKQYYYRYELYVVSENRFVVFETTHPCTYRSSVRLDNGDILLYDNNSADLFRRKTPPQP